MSEQKTHFGPLQALLDDPEVVEIFVDGYDRIYADRRGKLVDSAEHFADADALLQAVRAIITPLGGVLNESHPMIDVRLPDRSRMTVVIPPISVNGPVLVIRKFREEAVTFDDLIEWGAFSPTMASFLTACVVGGANILVSGGAGSGKTTLMNCLCQLLPREERIITIEHEAQLALRGPRQVRLETRPPNDEHRGGVSVRDLILQALKMRPERLIVSELNGSEVLHLLQAINTGHNGSMAAIHATSPQDALARMEIMATMGEISLPLLTIRQQIASALNLIVQINHMADGVRRVTHISELIGLERDLFTLRDIFRFAETPTENESGLRGQFSATGHVPSFVPALRQRGAVVGLELFAAE
jgi:pilus assembly protein CpaF